MSPSGGPTTVVLHPITWSPVKSVRVVPSSSADEEAWLLPAHFPTPTAAKVRRDADGFQIA